MVSALISGSSGLGSSPMNFVPLVMSSILKSIDILDKQMNELE